MARSAPKSGVKFMATISGAGFRPVCHGHKTGHTSGMEQYYKTSDQVNEWERKCATVQHKMRWAKPTMPGGTSLRYVASTLKCRVVGSRCIHATVAETVSCKTIKRQRFVTSADDVMFYPAPCLSVNNYRMNLYENFASVATVDKEQLVRFWKPSTSRSSNFLKDCYSTLRDEAFFYNLAHIFGITGQTFAKNFIRHIFEVESPVTFWKTSGSEVPIRIGFASVEDCACRVLLLLTITRKTDHPLSTVSVNKMHR